MSKYLLSVFAAIMCGISLADFTPAEKEFMNRRRAVKRERVTIGTNQYWIVTYMKGAKPDGVTTNLAYSIEGKPQTNPTEEDARWTRKARKDAEKAEKHDKKNFENWLKDTFKARDKSTTEITNFYNDIIFFATNRKDKAEAKVRDTDKTDATAPREEAVQ